MSVLAVRMSGSTALDSEVLLLELSVVQTEEESIVRMLELTRDRSMVKAPLDVLPLTGTPTPMPPVGAEPPGAAEKRELRSKFVNWSPVATLAPTAAAGGELISSLLGVKVGMVSIWLRRSEMEKKHHHLYSSHLRKLLSVHTPIRGVVPVSCACL